MMFVPFNDSSPTKLQIMIFCATNVTTKNPTTQKARSRSRTHHDSAHGERNQPEPSRARSLFAHTIHKQLKHSTEEKLKCETTTKKQRHKIKASTHNKQRQRQKKSSSSSNKHKNLTYALDTRMSLSIFTVLECVLCLTPKRSHWRKERRTMLARATVENADRASRTYREQKKQIV